MHHAYKLLYIFRPLIWFLVATMVAAFGRRFLKRLLSIIAIFLLVISIGGCYLMEGYYEKILDPSYLVSTDEWTECIVGTVTVICFLTFAAFYMLSAQAVDRESGEEEKLSLFTRVMQRIVGTMVAFILPFAIMGYCLPFFFLDSIAGIIVGVIGEGVGIALAVAIIRGVKKKDKSSDANSESKEAVEEEKDKSS